VVLLQNAEAGAVEQAESGRAPGSRAQKGRRTTSTDGSTYFLDRIGWRTSLQAFVPGNPPRAWIARPEEAETLNPIAVPGVRFVGRSGGGSTPSRAKRLQDRAIQRAGLRPRRRLAVTSSAARE
jgi:hypothetical protein